MGQATRETHCGTAPAFGLIVVENANDRGAWVHAGRVYQRLQLAATLEGIADASDLAGARAARP